MSEEIIEETDEVEETPKKKTRTKKEKKEKKEKKIKKVKEKKKFSLRQKKRVQNISITDYAIRLVENKNEELSTVGKLREEVVPEGILENGRIVDEVEYFKFIKQIVKKWSLAKENIRFFVPDSILVMRPVIIPSNLKEDEIQGHFSMEIGNTIHLPFEEPIIDVHVFPKEEENDEQKGQLYAASEEELMKHTAVFADALANPISANVQPLSVYKYYDYLYKAEADKTYLFFEINLLSVHVSIFTGHRLEFMRYQSLDFERSNWSEIKNKKEESIDWEFTGAQERFDNIISAQINEIEHIIDFYKSSVKTDSSDNSITDIIVLGDMPDINQFVGRINEQYNIPTILLKGYLSQDKHDLAYDKFVPALGLSLEGGH